MRDLRLLRRWSQERLAEIMAEIGHSWTQATVSDIESGGRRISIDELAGLALCFGVAFSTLLDPAGIEGRDRRPLDYGSLREPLDIIDAIGWVTGDVVSLPFDESGSVVPNYPLIGVPSKRSNKVVERFKRIRVKREDQS